MLTDKSIHHIIRHLEKGRGTRAAAEEIKMSQRHIRRRGAEYLNNVTVHIQGRVERGPRRRTLECQGKNGTRHTSPLARPGAVDRKETSGSDTIQDTKGGVHNRRIS